MSKPYGAPKPSKGPGAPRMTEAGIVIDVTPKGALVKATRMFPIGTHLVDVRAQPAGRVADVIGPEKAPYLLVNSGKGSKPQRLLRQTVFVP